MEQMTFTPGPWVAERDPDHYDTLSTVTAGDVRAKPPINRLCIQVGGFAGPVEQEANARLISAAPDLLAALINLLSAKRGEGGTKYNSDDIADAAISKAIGA